MFGQPPVVFGMSEKQVAAQFQFVVEVSDQFALRHFVEVNQHVTTEDGIKSAVHRPRGSGQIQLAKRNQPLNLGADPALISKAAGSSLKHFVAKMQFQRTCFLNRIDTLLGEWEPGSSGVMG